MQFLINWKRNRLFAASVRRADAKEALHPLKTSSSSSSSRWQRRVRSLVGRNGKFRNSSSASKSSTSSSCPPPDPVTSSSSASSASASSGAEYSYHDRSINSQTSSLGLGGGITPSIHDLRSIPSMGESVLGVYLETSRSEDSLYFTSRSRDDSAPPTRDAVKASASSSSCTTPSCVRVPQWMTQWKDSLSIRSLGPHGEAVTKRQGRRRRPGPRSKHWRSYYSRACRKPLADAVHSHEDDDEDHDDVDDDDVDSLQASAHFSISCLSHGRNSNVMDRLPWESHEVDDDMEDDDDDFALLRGNAPMIATTSTLNPMSMGRGASGMTLDSYLSRHNPHAKPSKASKGTKATKTTAASTTLATGTTQSSVVAGSASAGAKTVVDIAHVDTCDNQSVHSDMVMAVSFDHDYAQLVLTATAQEESDDDDEYDECYDDEEELESVNDELLGIAHSHPAAEILERNGCPSPPPSFVRGENKAPRYAMQRNGTSNGVKSLASSHRLRNPWREMVVEDNDDDAGSFRGVEEWSVAAASVLIETTFTDWGESHDEDDDDGSVVKKRTGAQRVTAKTCHAPCRGVEALKSSSRQLPPRPSSTQWRSDESAGTPVGEADEASLHSSDSECPFDERAWKAPHLRSAQPGRPPQVPAVARSGSKRGVQLVGV